MKKTIFILCCLIITLCALLFYPEKKPTRYAVFAGFNANGTIDDYVITYLKGLDEVTDGIVYIADSSLNDGDLCK